MQVNFYIEKKNKSEVFQVLMYVTDPVFKPKVKFYTGEKVHKKEWAKGRATKRMGNLNDFLDSQKKKADDIRLKLKAENRFTRENFIIEFKGEKKAKRTLYEWFDAWIIFCQKNDSESTDKERTERTIQIYGVLKNILSDYEKKRKKKLNPSSFDKDFYRDFKKYCIEERINENGKGKGVSLNTFYGYIKVLRQFLGWLYEKVSMTKDYENYRVNFTKSEDKPFKDEELRWFYDQDIFKYSYVKKLILKSRESDKHNDLHKDNIRKRIQALEQGRLILLLLCCTGKRISDYQKMNHAEIDGDIIKFMTQKTKEVCYVPYFDDMYFRPKYVIEEMNKKFGGLPKISDKSIRDSITELCKVIGFNRFKVKPKTGRKTHATIKTLKGVPPAITRIATGHKTEKSFNDYVEIDQFDVLKGYKEKSTPYASETK